MNVSVTAEEWAAARAAFRRHGQVGHTDTGRYRLRYLSWGRGPVVVFIPGMADRAAAFLMVMHRLANHHSCVAYELPDGTTDGSRLARYRLPDYVADLLALLDHLKVSRAAVVGSSFGSLVALAAGFLCPGRVTHVILQNGFAHRPLNPFQRGLARLARYWPGWFGDWPEIQRASLWAFEGEMMRALPAVVSRVMLHNAGRTPIRAAAFRALTIDRTDLRPFLPQIRRPLLLITGDCDRLVPRACWDEISRFVPTLRRVELAGCGHYPQYTHPGPMATVLRAFLGRAYGPCS